MALDTCVLSLPVLQVQQGRDEVSLDFSLDDTGGDREDALVGMSFHVPREVQNFQAEEDSTSTKVVVLGCNGIGCTRLNTS